MLYYPEIAKVYCNCTLTTLTRYRMMYYVNYVHAYGEELKTLYNIRIIKIANLISHPSEIF